MMEIKILEHDFTVCKVKDLSQADLADEYFFIGKSEEELSLVCRTQCVPDNTVAREDGWRGFRVEGVLDFSLIGILAKISAVLAEAEIGIFVVSTYNTDYVLTKSKDFHRAVEALEEEGYKVVKVG